MPDNKDSFRADRAAPYPAINGLSATEEPEGLGQCGMTKE